MLVAAGVIGAKLGVDEVFDLEMRDRRDRSPDPVMERRTAAVDHDEAVLCGGDGDVSDISALAFQHVDAIGKLDGLDAVRRQIDGGLQLWLGVGGRSPQHARCNG